MRIPHCSPQTEIARKVARAAAGRVYEVLPSRMVDRALPVAEAP